MFCKSMFDYFKWQILILQIFQIWFDSIPSSKSKVINKTVKRKRKRKKKFWPSWPAQPNNRACVYVRREAGRVSAHPHPLSSFFSVSFFSFSWKRRPTPERRPEHDFFLDNLPIPFKFVAPSPRNIPHIIPHSRAVPSPQKSQTLASKRARFRARNPPPPPPPLPLHQSSRRRR